MPILKVANVHMNLSGSDRIEYLGDNVIRFQANAIQVPIGTSAQRPTAGNGYIRYNTDLNKLEAFVNTEWDTIPLSNSLPVGVVFAQANAAYDKANSANVLAFNTGIGANAYTNTYAAAVGTAGNAYTVTVGTAGNTYARAVGTAGNSYAQAVGTAGNNYTITVGAAANNYSNTLSVLGKQTIYVPATSMIPQVTNGAAYGQLEMNTNRNMISFLAFDSTTSEGAQFSVQMPKSWNEGNVVGQFIWTQPIGTSAANAVVWSIRSVARSNNETLDVAFGPFSNATANGGTANSLYISPETGNVSVSTASVAEEYVTFQINRQPANAGDTMGVDAYLLGVKIHYTIDAAKDN